MPSDPLLESARHEWADEARHRIRTVTEAVDRLRKGFGAAPKPGEEDAALAEEVVDRCGGLTEWMAATHAPRGLAKAEGELAAAAGVYKNAAFAFRSLIDAEPDQLEPRAAACATMLEQGDGHVHAFAATLLRKLGPP